MFTFVGFLLGLGLAYVVFPFEGPLDDKGVERFVISAIGAALGFALGRIANSQAGEASPSSPKSPPADVDRKTSSANPAKTPSAPLIDPTDQLKKLAELHAAGVLTDDEFAAKKKDLLDRM